MSLPDIAAVMHDCFHMLFLFLFVPTIPSNSLPCFLARCFVLFPTIPSSSLAGFWQEPPSSPHLGCSSGPLRCVTLQLQVPKVRPWSAEDPFLYPLLLEVITAGAADANRTRSEDGTPPLW